MDFAHLINCILLAYGPFFIVYRAKKLNEFDAYYFCFISGIAYLITTGIKMIMLANLVTMLENILYLKDAIYMEFFKCVFSVIDIIGLYILLKQKLSILENVIVKILTVSIGWSFTESICNYLFYFVMNSSQEGFSWKFIYKSLFCNVEFLEMFFAVFLVMQISKIKSIQNFQGILLCVLLLSRNILFPTFLKYLYGIGDDVSLDQLITKFTFTLGFGFASYTLKLF